MKIREFMTEEELDRVVSAVKDAELKTSGEIRVKIIGSLEEGIKNSREQAIHEFYREGMDKTRGKTGVLILLVLSTRRIEILADSGINEKVEPGTWDEVVDIMTDAIHQKKHCEAICEAVEIVGEILVKHFPRQPDDVNELPDEVIRG